LLIQNAKRFPITVTPIPTTFFLKSKLSSKDYREKESLINHSTGCGIASASLIFSVIFQISNPIKLNFTKLHSSAFGCLLKRHKESTKIMKRRYIYSLLFGVPGFIVSLIVSFVVSGFAGGVLWIYGFGDNPWPAYIENILPVLLALVFMTVWLASLTIGFITGKKLEQNPILNKKHILTSIGVTIISILFIVFHQLSVGNIGPKSDSLRCSDFCSQKGYSASSMPPRDSGERSCSCLDQSGHEIIRVPLDSIDPFK